MEYVKLFSWADIAHGFNFIPRLSIELRNEVDDDEAEDCLVISVDVVSDDDDVLPPLFVDEYSLLFICLYLVLQWVPNSLEEERHCCIFGVVEDTVAWRAVVEDNNNIHDITTNTLAIFSTYIDILAIEYRLSNPLLNTDAKK